MRLATGTLAALLQSPTGRIGCALSAIVVVLSLMGPLLVPYPPDQIALSEKLLPPGPAHLLGTDQFGRDVLARLLEGGRRSLAAAVLVLGGALAISLVCGLTAGISGGAADAAIMRVVDLLLAIPRLVLALAVVGALGPGFWNLLLALVVSSWAHNARLVRSYVLGAAQRPDVIAARMAGIPLPRIVAGHILPGVIAQLLVVATIELGGIIIGLAGLSFLGLGVQPPAAEWGAMLADTRLFFGTATWLLAAPAAAIFITVTGVNLVADAVRDAADPRLVQ
jgi:ABC-type dipeptide/oligopeptide/nickel transport system permease subunit